MRLDELSRQPCSPGIARSANYPHTLVLSCWEHGAFADLGYAPSVALVVHLVDEHHAKIRAVTGGAGSAVSAPESPAFEDDPVAMALGLTPRTPGVLIPGEPNHCHQCALEHVARLRAETARLQGIEQRAITEVDRLRAEVERMRPVIDAARAHRPVEETGVDHECYIGNCNHEDECPERAFIACRECLRISLDINDETIPNAVMAENCAVCAAVAALDAGGRPSDQRHDDQHDENDHQRVTQGDVHPIAVPNNKEMQ